MEHGAVRLGRARQGRAWRGMGKAGLEISPLFVCFKVGFEYTHAHVDLEQELPSKKFCDKIDAKSNFLL